MRSEERKFHRSNSFKIEAEVEKLRGLRAKLDKSLSTSQIPIVTVSSEKGYERIILKEISKQERTEMCHSREHTSSTQNQYGTSVTMRYGQKMD